MALSAQEMMESVRWLGVPIKVHEVGEYAFVEYQDQVISDPQPTPSMIRFSVFVDGESTSRSCNSLDEALVFAIACKHDGLNTRAHIYFLRGIGVGTAE